MTLYPATELDTKTHTWATEDGRVFTMIGGALLAMTADEARKLADDIRLTVARIEARTEVEASAE